MKKSLPALLFVLLALPVSALAQQTMPPGGGPPPEVRAQMEQARDQARTNAMNALSADHRAKVQAIVAQVESGSLSRQDARSQIDALLTPQETQAVLAQGQKLRDEMRAAFQAQNAGGPGGPGEGPGPGHGPGGEHRTPDAGRFLLMLNRRPPSPPPNP